MPTCPHLDDLPDPLPSYDPTACAGCVAAGRDDWVHLRSCLTCGVVGCCDSSPLHHARDHMVASGHPLIRSVEPGEDWRWCYVDQVLV